jgi:hypothetical protein
MTLYDKDEASDLAPKEKQALKGAIGLQNKENRRGKSK